MKLFAFPNCLVQVLAQVLALVLSAEAAPKLLPSSLNPDVTHFAVDSLPNVTFSLPPSWAGQISIPGLADDQLFFWLFQAEDRNASENLISKTKSRWFAGKSLTSIQFG